MDEDAQRDEGAELVGEAGLHGEVGVGTDDRVLSLPAVARAARVFCIAVGGGFLLTTGIGAVSPAWGLAIAHAVQRFYVAPGHFLAQYLSAQLTITLANSLAALGASILGACGAVRLARIQLADAAADRSYGALGRASYVMVWWFCRAMRARICMTGGLARTG